MMKTSTRAQYVLLPQSEDQTPKDDGRFREDIAFLRALAILAVLAYHFFPIHFPFGFIGVDIFFVISGYLMMVILERTQGNPFQITTSFYYRRFKRLCPLYFLIVFLAGLAAMFVYTPVWAEKHFSYYLSSILFTLNLRMLSTDGNYFETTTTDMPFLHFWSLSVEIQFYLVAPLIFYISRVNIKGFRVGHFLLLSATLISMIFQIKSTPITAFYHPFSRLWQFMIGIISAIFTKSITSFMNSKTLSDSLINVISFSLMLSILAIFSPIPYLNQDSNIPRILITIVAGLFMLFTSNGSINWSRFQLQYIATISYSLYLVHYPVLRFTHYLADYYEYKENEATCFALFLTFLISIILHHLYEKPHLIADRFEIFKQILKYFCLCLLVNWGWHRVANPDCFLKAAIHENSKYAAESLFILKDGQSIKDGWGNGVLGHYRWKNGTGSHKVVIVGNSWAAQLAHIVREILDDSYVSTMEMFSYSASVAVFHEMGERGRIFWEYVEKTKPDIVFILLRYSTVQGDTSEIKANDTILQGYLQGIQRLSKHAGLIFIQGDQPFCPHQDVTHFLNKFIDRLQKGGDLANFNPDFDADVFDNNPPHRRLKVVFENCSKCHRLNLAEPFLDRSKKKVLMYDEKTQLSYLDNGCHLTQAGLDKIKKPFRDTVEAVLRLKRGKAIIAL